jgi:glutaredoxin 3
VSFVNYNIAEDPEARERLKQLTGRLATPVITVDDEIVVGFDRGKVQRLLGLQ